LFFFTKESAALLKMLLVFFWCFFHTNQCSVKLKEIKPLWGKEESVTVVNMSFQALGSSC
jgi:hypothetical protein